MTDTSEYARFSSRASIYGSGFFLSAAILSILLISPSAAAGQLTSSGATGLQAAPSVFLDCQRGVPCNENHFRTEIQFVNWARDRADSDVHVLVTGESVGGGGRRYTLEFMGRGDMSHLSDLLTYTAGGTDVSLQTQDGLTQALRLGLMRFAVQAGFGTDFRVEFNRELVGSDGTDATAQAAAAVQDPWNYWTFRVGFSGNMSITENRSTYRSNPSFSADRVTDDWKLNMSFFSSLRWDKIILSDDRVVRNDVNNWATNALMVRSISPNVSTGFTAGAGSSVANNTLVRMEVTPGIEWNYYPYTEASRRQLIAHYSVGVQYSDYREETIFNLMQETVPLHQFGAQYRAVAAWGNAGVGIDASQYLHGSGLYNLGASGNISLRVARGLELSLAASGSRVADQIHIPLESISEEDILLGRQSLPTGYQYQSSIGLNYRWGSSFSNIVNVRFPRSVR